MVDVRVQIVKYKGQIYTMATSSEFKMIVRGPPTTMLQILCRERGCDDLVFKFTKVAYKSLVPRKMKLINTLYPNLKIEVDKDLYEMGYVNLIRQKLFRQMLKDGEVYKYVEYTVKRR